MTPKLNQLLASATSDQLNRVTPEELLSPFKVVSTQDAMLVKAALYLKHGYLDACHKIAQQVETPNGSYWHAIMHRKEGDFSNSKYWYQRVGQHPIFDELGDDWDPSQFVDDCQRRANSATAEREQREFDALLRHTFRAATTG